MKTSFKTFAAIIAMSFAASLATAAPTLTPNPQASAATTNVSADTSRLEQDYWKCIDLDDQAVKADTQMGDESIMICSVVSRALQKAKFSDDFGLLHAWTNTNKSEALARLRALPSQD